MGVVSRLILVRYRESPGAVERFRRRKARQGRDMVRLRPGPGGRMGLLFPGGNRKFEAQDVGDPEEKFALFGEEKVANLTANKIYYSYIILCAAYKCR